MAWIKYKQNKISSILIIGILIITPRSLVLAQALSQDQQDSNFIAGRIDSLRKEISEFTERLKDGGAIVRFYDVITKEFLDYKNTMDIYIKNCAAKKLEYEKMREDNDPFHHRYWPGVQRCQNDRDGFNVNIQKFGLEMNKIEKDMLFIGREVERLKNNSNRSEQEMKLFELRGRMNNQLTNMGNQIGGFKKPSY